MLTALLLSLPLATAQDITVSSVATNLTAFATIAGTSAFCSGVTVCNLGSLPAPWSLQAQEAPAYGQNLFRIYDGRMEQLGYSFLVRGICPINEIGCGACQATPCNSLGAGCASTRSTTGADGASGFTKSAADPTLGTYDPGAAGPSGPSPNAGRLLVSEAELDAPGANFIYEGQYIYAIDHQAGQSANNLGWRRLTGSMLAPTSDVGVGEPAIFAWARFDSAVVVTHVPNLDEGGAGIDGHYYVGHAVRDLGGGFYRYDYAVQNTTSAVAARSFEVDLGCSSGGLTNPFFRGVSAHSGDPWDDTDWSFSLTSDSAGWSGPDFASNPAGNALRWGTLYTFGFVAESGPVLGDVRIGLFSGGGTLTSQALVPGSSFPITCSANPNSTGQPCAIAIDGSASLLDADLRLQLTQLPSNTLGYFLMSKGQQFVPNFGGSQGNLCIGNMTSPIVRFAGNVLDSGPLGLLSFQLDFNNLPQGTTFQLGESWYFQYWHRDFVPQPTSNTSPAIQVTFCP